ncbi:MAG TPA: PAS domain S-box protein [Macromonas sp.]|nr:PAS domain S-box protein [Macromonas sp.]
MRAPLAITLGYVLAGKLALMLALPPGYASAIFPPAGIAVAAALVGGRRSLPWSFLGSLLLNLWVAYASPQPISGLGLLAALVIALASVAQAAVGGWWLRRALGYPTAFDRAPDIARFLMLSPVICLISASLSVAGLTLLGILSEADWVTNWATWWLGDTLGVIVVAPLVLVVAGEPRALWRHREYSVAVPMLLAFTIFVFIFIRANHWEQEESLMEFRAQSQRVADQIQTQFDTQEFLLEELSTFLSEEKQHAPSAEAFHRFITRSLTRFAELQSVDWAPRVERSQRHGFEAEQRRRVADYEIREIAAAPGQLKRAAERAYYYPITWIEPATAGNQGFLGFDIASTPERQLALNRSREINEPVATEPLHLATDATDSYGVLLMLPVQHPSTPGVVLTALRIADFIERTPTYRRSTVQLRFTDVASSVPLFDTIRDSARTAEYEQTLHFGTRTYRVEFVPTQNYLLQHRGWQSWTVLTVGLFSTGLLGALLLLTSGYTARVEADVKANVAELKESTEKLRGLFELSPLGIALTDMNGRYVEFNSAFAAICGYPADELKQLDYWTLTPPQYADDEAKQLALLATQGRYGPYVKEYRRKDGSLVPLSLNGLLLTGKNGEQYVWSIVEDISERRQVEETLRQSEERWKFALEGAGDGVWDWNLVTGEMFLSRQEMTVLGYDGEDACMTDIGIWIERQHPHDRAQRKEALQAHLAGNAPVYASEFRTRCRDGRWKWIRARGMLVSRTPDGQPLRMIGTHTDIDALKRQAAKEAMHSAVMELLVRSRTLDAILAQIVTCLERDDADLAYAVLVAHGDHLHLRTCPPFPPEMRHRKIRFDGETLQPAGEALYMGGPVRAPVHAGTYWNELSQLAADAGFQVCWSEPLLSAEPTRTVEGALIAFQRQPHTDALPDLENMQHAANLIRIAIQEKRVEEQLQLAASVYNASSEGIVVMDASNRVIAVNPAFTRITGFDAQEVVGRDIELLHAPEENPALYRSIWERLTNTGLWDGEILTRRKNNETYPARLAINSIRNDAGELVRKVCMFSDITDKKMVEERIYHLARHDALTGLPNRTFFADRLQQAIVQSKRDRNQLALLYVDLDLFKPVNDTLGHHVGDQLLQSVAQRMKAQVRESDTVARLGGDEFVVLLPSVNGENDALLVAEKIRQALVQPFELGAHRINISSSIGIAVYPAHGEDDKQLSTHADRAMYFAKKNGRNIVEIYRSSMEA